jgi:hypothetical protein
LAKKRGSVEVKLFKLREYFLVGEGVFYLKQGTGLRHFWLKINDVTTHSLHESKSHSIFKKLKNLVKHKEKILLNVCENFDFVHFI